MRLYEDWEVGIEDPEADRILAGALKTFQQFGAKELVRRAPEFQAQARADMIRRRNEMFNRYSNQPTEFYQSQQLQSKLSTFGGSRSYAADVKALDLLGRRAVAEMPAELLNMLTTNDAIPDEEVENIFKDWQKMKIFEAVQTRIGKWSANPTRAEIEQAARSLKPVSPAYLEAARYVGLFTGDPEDPALAKAMDVTFGSVKRFVDRAMRAADIQGGGQNNRYAFPDPRGLIELVETIPDWKKYWNQAAIPSDPQRSTFGQLFAEGLGMAAGSAPNKAIGFAADFYVSSKADPYIAFVGPMVSELSLWRFSRRAEPLIQAARAGDFTGLLDDTIRKTALDSTMVHDAAQLIADSKSSYHISRLGKMLGADWDSEILPMLKGADTKQQVLELFEDGMLGRNGLSPLSVRAFPRLPRTWTGWEQRTVSNWEGPVGKTARTLKRWGTPPPTKRITNVFDQDLAEEFTRLGRVLKLSDDEIGPYFDEFTHAAYQSKNLFSANAVTKRMTEDALETKWGISKKALNDWQSSRSRNAIPGAEELSQAYGALAIGLLPDEIPISIRQLGNKIYFPDYRALTKFRVQLEGGQFRKSLNTINEGLDEALRPVRAVWLAAGRFGARFTMDELAAGKGRFGFKWRDWFKEAGGAWNESMMLSRRKPIQWIGEQLNSFEHAVADHKGIRTILPREMHDLPAVSPRVLAASDRSRLWTSGAPRPLDLAVDEQEAIRLVTLADKEVDLKSWRYVSNIEPHHLASWNYVVNNHLVGDPIFDTFIHHADDVAGARAEISEWLRSDVGKDYLGFMAGSLRRTTPKMDTEVASVMLGAPKELLDQAVRGEGIDRFLDAQQRIYTHVIGPKLARIIRETGNVTRADLESIPVNARPTVWGADLVPKRKTSHAWQAFNDTIGWFMHQTMGFVDNTIRKPEWRMLYRPEFEARRNIAQQLGTLGTQVSEDYIALKTSEWVTSQQLKLVHNPAERTVFDIAARSTVAFSFARIQFYKRWARVFAEQPAYARKMQLLVGAGMDNGWIEEDEEGNLSLQIPVLPDLLEELGKATLGLPDGWAEGAFRFTISRGHKDPGGAIGNFQAPFRAFNKAAVPPALPFSGELYPGFFPTVTLPVANIIASRPTPDWVKDFFFGEFQKGTEPGVGFMDRMAKQLMPAWADKLSLAFHGDMADKQYGNAYIDAVRYMLVKGTNPFAGAYVDKDNNLRLAPNNEAKVANITRLLFITRGLTQFFSPYTPAPNMPGAKYAKRWQELRAEYGPEEALLRFVDENGQGAIAYTVPKTEGTGRWTMPASEESTAFAASHQKFFETYRDVAVFFAPIGQYQAEAVGEQMTLHLRENMTPGEWMMQAIQRIGDTLYYDKIKPGYDNFKKSGASRQQLAEWLAGQKEFLDELLPGWKTWNLRTPERMNARMNAISQLRQAANDKAVADNPVAQHLRTFMLSYDQAWAEARNKGHRSWTSKKLDPLKSWLKQRWNDTQQTPELERIWFSVFRPLIDDFEEE